MFKSIKFFKEQSREEYGLLCVARNDICSAGRSMIEMLGVLAIVGVLSVGGIAGYSKAMEKFKVNKAISQYSMLIYDMLEFHHNLDYDYDTGLVDIFQATQSIPPDWEKVNDTDLKDSYGNIVSIRGSRKYIMLSLTIGGELYGNHGTIPSSLCVSFINDLMLPLHNSLYVLAFFNPDDDPAFFYYGDNYCGGNNKCITDLSLPTIESLCKSSKDGLDFGNGGIIGIVFGDGSDLIQR